MYEGWLFCHFTGQAEAVAAKKEKRKLIKLLRKRGMKRIVSMRVCVWVFFPSFIWFELPSTVCHQYTPAHPAVMSTWHLLGWKFNWLLSCISYGPGGTLGAHTRCWEKYVLLRAPSPAPGVCLALAHSACLVHKQPGFTRCPWLLCGNNKIRICEREREIWERERAHVCGCVVDGVIATAATWVYYYNLLCYYFLATYQHMSCSQRTSTDIVRLLWS